MNKEEILILGSLAYDYIMSFQGDLNNNLTSNPDEKVFNLTLMPTTKKINFGGTSGNISYNLGQISAPVQIITSVGEDFINLGYKEHISQNPSINFNGDIHKNLFTASCYIVNDQNFNQLIIFHEGAMKKCPEINLIKKKVSAEIIKIASISPDNVNAMEKWAEELSSLKIPFIFDPGQVTPAFTKELLEKIIPKAFILIGNEFEINLIQKKLNKDLKELLELNSKLIITKGDKGSECYENGQLIKIPSVSQVQVMDTTGAGDAYRAGLLFGLFNDLPISYSCKIGTIMSSFSIETVGPQTQKFDMKKIKKRFEEEFNDEIIF